MSQQDAQSEVIEGVRYTVYMLPPKKARRLLLRIMKVISPALGPVIDAGSSSKGLGGLLDQDLSDGTVSRALTELFDRLDEDTFDYMIDTLIAVSEADGKQLADVQDFLWRGQLGAMLKFMVFALKVQFANFTDALASASAEAAPVKAEGPRSLNISTG